MLNNHARRKIIFNLQNNNDKEKNILKKAIADGAVASGE